MCNGKHTMHNRAEDKWGHPEAVQEGFYTSTAADYIRIGHLPLEDQFAEIEVSDNFLRSAMPAFSNDYIWENHYAKGGVPENTELNDVRLLVGMPKDIKPNEKLPVFFVGASGILINTTSPAEAGPVVFFNWAKEAVERFIMVSYDVTQCIPKYTYPGCVDEAHCAYQYMINHAEEFHINLKKIILAGNSNGGFASLSTAFRIQKHNWCGAPMPRGIVLTVPVMNDIADTNSHRIIFTHEDGSKGTWDAEQNQYCLRKWLGDKFADPTLDPEIVPTRATVDDIKKGFPPTWFITAEFDPGRDGVYDFAQKLHEAGVFCDVHVWGGNSHVVIMCSESHFGQRVHANVVGALRDSVLYDFRRKWLNE